MNRRTSYEMRHVSPLRCANVVGLVYGLFLIPWTLLAIPFLLLIPFTGDAWTAGEAIAKGLIVAMVLSYPVLGFIFGWIGGLLFSAIYNLVVNWIGGFRFKLDVLPSHPESQGLTGGGGGAQ